jgi:hypothetical protein
LITAWQNNYGRGPAPPESPDPVGGFYCWDWAEIFHDAVGENDDCFSFFKWSALNPKPEKDETGAIMRDEFGRPIHRVHYFLWVYVGGASTDKPIKGCNAVFDDGFFDKTLSHDGTTFIADAGWDVVNPKHLGPPPLCRDRYTPIALE